MQVVRLNNPFYNGFAPKDAEKANEILAQYTAVYDAIAAGTAYVRFVDGDRKGSIARLKFEKYENGIYSSRPRISENHRNSWSRELTKKLDHLHIWCVATWDGRANKPKITVPNDDIVILLDYDGPTIWEKFDAQAAKAELLKNPDQKDINGNVLSVGDSVLYINARYGSRMTLEEGMVVEFLASVNSKEHTITTVIESKTGEQSSLQYPESMVYRMGSLRRIVDKLQDQ